MAQTEGSVVRLPVSAHVWFVRSIPLRGMCKRQPGDVSHIDVSLSLFLPASPLSKITKGVLR